MDTKDFSVFRTLLSEVHTAAFGEPLTRLPHSKAQTLSWLIEEATGEVLSYKTLGNYVNAAIQGSPIGINPNASTLSLLVQYAGAQTPPSPSSARENPGAAWFRYRRRFF